VLFWLAQLIQERGGVTGFSYQKQPGSLGRWVLIAWSVLSILAVTAHLFSATVSWTRPEIRMVRSVGDLGGLVAEILERVPSDAPVLVDTWQAPRVPADQFLERELAYWIFPRRVYSASAIRGSRRSLEEFVTTHKIGWVVHGQRLVEVEAETVESVLGPLKPEDNEVVASPGLLKTLDPLRYPAPMGWLLFGVAVVITIAGGRGLLLSVGVDSQLSSTSERWGWSWLAGLAVTSLAGLLLFLCGKPVAFWLPLLPNLVLGGVAVGLRKRGTGGPGEDIVMPGDVPQVSANRRSRLLVPVLVLFVVVVVIAAIRGIEGFDQRMQWAYKARLMQTEPGPWDGSVFQDPDHVHFHPRYPLLVPAAEAVFGGAGGYDSSDNRGFSESTAVLMFPLTWLALGGVVIGGLVRLGSRDPVRGGVLLLMLPVWFGLGALRNNLAAFKGCPELLVGAALLSAVVAALAALDRGRGWWFLVGLCLVVAGLAKAEGTVAVAVLVGVAGIAHRQRRVTWEIVLTAVVVALVLATHEVVFTRGVVAGVLPDDYRQLLTVSGVVDGLWRLPGVVGKFLVEAAVAPWFGAVGLLMVVAIFQDRGGWRTLAVGWPLVTSGLMLAAFCVPFLVIPDYENNLEWAAGRLVMQIAPLATWSLVVMLHRGETDPVDESVDSLSGDGARVGSE
jgi:hypothetical protein